MNENLTNHMNINVYAKEESKKRIVLFLNFLFEKSNKICIEKKHIIAMLYNFDKNYSKEKIKSVGVDFNLFKKSVKNVISKKDTERILSYVDMELNNSKPISKSMVINCEVLDFIEKMNISGFSIEDFINYSFTQSNLEKILLEKDNKEKKDNIFSKIKNSMLSSKMKNVNL